jgi:hypothetical protein
MSFHNISLEATSGEKELNLNKFKVLRPHKARRLHQYLDPATLAPLYTTIARETPFQPAKPDIRVFAGSDKAAPLVGVVKMHKREYVIGLGNPKAAEEGNEVMVWEGLKRMEKWTYKTYMFEYNHGDGRGRVVYTWRRTKVRMLKYLKEMELRVGGVEDGEGELVALWKAEGKSVILGNLFLKEREDGSEEARKMWELMVVLTSQAIVAGVIRRAK